MKSQIKRVPTGISGFDELVCGGFPQNFVVLLAGTPGTGKSIFSLAYIYNGAVNFNENGVYVTLEQTPEDLKTQALQFGWDFDELEREGKVSVVSFDELGVDETIKKIGKAVEELKAKRLVVDSLSGMQALLSIHRELLSQMAGSFSFGSDTPIRIIPDKESLRKIIWNIFRELKKLNCTTMIPSEIPTGTELLSVDGVSEFACDGIIALKKASMGREEVRTISVEKMRSTVIDGGTHDLEFTEKGVTVVGE